MSPQEPPYRQKAVIQMEEKSNVPVPNKGRSAAGIALIAFLAIVFVLLIVLVLRVSRSSTPAPAPSESSEVYVVPLGLRLRAEPNTRAEILATLPRSTQLTLLEMEGAWARVRLTDGREGWTDRNALESAGDRDRRMKRATAIRELPPLEGRVINDAQLYAGPGLFYPVIGQLEQNSEIRVFTRDHEFYAVDLGDGIAYAEVQAVELSDTGDYRFDVAATDTQTDEVPAEPEDPQPADEPARTAEDVRPSFEDELRERTEREARETRADTRRIYPNVPSGGRPPEITRRDAPDYPIAARRAGIEGAVILRAVINRDGTVGDVDIVKDLPLGLGEAAARSVRRWRFQPATLDGTPISVYYTITVNYRLQ